MNSIYLREKRTSKLKKLIWLIIISALLIWGFILAELITATEEKQTSKSSAPLISIHVEHLGKTERELKAIYPDLFLEVNRKGELVGKHKLDGAQYTVWFVAKNQGKFAFRVKAEKKFTHKNENDLLNFFGEQYHRPFDSQCKGETANFQNQCHHKWWVRGGVGLDLYSRTNKKGELFITAISTDSYLYSKHFQDVEKATYNR